MVLYIYASVEKREFCAFYHRKERKILVKTLGKILTLALFSRIIEKQG